MLILESLQQLCNFDRISQQNFILFDNRTSLNDEKRRLAQQLSETTRQANVLESKLRR